MAAVGLHPDYIPPWLGPSNGTHLKHLTLHGLENALSEVTAALFWAGINVLDKFNMFQTLTH